MSKLVKNITKNNVFHRDCECDFDRWLMVVTGETDFVNPSDWTIVMLNSSLCQVPLFAKGCFSRAEVQLSKYDMKMCSMMGEFCTFLLFSCHCDWKFKYGVVLYPKVHISSSF